MLFRIKQAFVMLAAALLIIFPASSFSATETTTITTTTTEGSGVTTIVPGTYTIPFVDFDLNRDRIVSINEIGEMLFRQFDTDDNGVIDNNEYDRKAILTVAPAIKETTVSYDFDGDGMVDKTQRTYETFLQDTLLASFDRNRNGLSPTEFTGRDFMEADVNNDRQVDLKEWQGSYIASIDRANKDKASLNR